jgi:choline dehydrogenase-like flavoprotein
VTEPSVVRGRTLTGDVSLEADAVVVGTGAGGSVALRELARAGLSAIALEEGGFHQAQDFDQREDHMLPLLFQDGGARSTDDLAIRVLGGRGVGGSTIHNTNLCKRTPDPILELWAKKYGVEGASPAEMAEAFASIEKDLSVSSIPASDVNANNDVLRRGLAALGWKGGVLAHNRVGCQKSGFCELGCSYDAKENAVKIVLPQAMAAGARIYADVDVRKVTVEKGAATGVQGFAHDGAGKRVASVKVRAKVVVLAGSAIGSAALARRSGLPDPHETLGKGLRMHPAGVVAGRFEERVAADEGIPQSWECTEHLSYEEGSDRRVWILPVFAHPIATASMLPGFGAMHMYAMRQYKNLAVLTAMVHDETSGEVGADSDGDPVIRYAMTEPDRAQLAKGLVASAKILFAAGAREVVFPGIRLVRLTSASELDGLDTSFVRAHGVPLSAVHPMGTLRMGKDPKTSVVTSSGEHHQVKGLFALDGSLFPTSLGGPPQISIYAFALHLAKHAVARARG